MADITKEQLKKEIQEILKDADLDNTSAKKVRLQLQEKLDCDLTERKKEVDQLVMEVIDEQTQDDDEEGEEEEESESEEEAPPKKKKTQTVQKKKKADSGDESGSNYSPAGSDEEEAEVPSDGGGSDYEPDEPVKIGRGKPKKKAAKRDSDDESSGEEWGGRKKGGKKGKKRGGSSDDEDSDYEKPKPKKSKAGGGAKGKGGYMKDVKLSDELADIVGGNEMPRHEVVKRMWAYIKENKLQDPKNKQFIKCDEKLSKIIPTKKFKGFGMTKFLKDHMD